MGIFNAVILKVIRYLQAHSFLFLFFSFLLLFFLHEYAKVLSVECRIFVPYIVTSTWCLSTRLAPRD